MYKVKSDGTEKLLSISLLPLVAGDMPNNITNFLYLDDPTKEEGTEVVHKAKRWFKAMQRETIAQNIDYEINHLTHFTANIATTDTGMINLSNDLKRLSRVLAYNIQTGDIHALVAELEQKADSKFLAFKDELKQHSMDDAQFSIAKSLNAIEDRVQQFPLLTPKQASIFLGDLASRNPSRTVNKAKEEGNIFVFYFGNTRTAQIPAFQFNTENLGVYDVVPRLTKALEGLNDWGVYSWFTTKSEDLDCTPAEAVSKPELYDELRYLAGLFKSDSTLRDLSFVANNEVGR
ncbi:TPA: hypothetical protein ACGU7E_003450 [Vibrio vulnificus]|uniref:hypothetical protein n=1 Tax=Vibrio vulnificus TaxID=672 RepID=UPI00324225F3